MFPWKADFLDAVNSADQRDRFVRIKRPHQGRRNAHELANDSLPISREGGTQEEMELWLRDYHGWPHCDTMVLELRYSGRGEEGEDGYITQCTLMPPRGSAPPQPRYNTPHQERPGPTSAEGHGGHGQGGAPPGGRPPGSYPPQGGYHGYPSHPPAPSWFNVFAQAAGAKLAERPELFGMFLQMGTNAIQNIANLTPEAMTQQLQQLQKTNLDLNNTLTMAQRHVEGLNQQLGAAQAQIHNLEGQLTSAHQELEQIRAQRGDVEITNLSTLPELPPDYEQQHDQNTKQVTPVFTKT